VSKLVCDCIVPDVLACRPLGSASACQPAYYLFLQGRA